MKSHLESCKQKLLRGPRKVECPFNPLHLINLMEIENHIMTCENRVVRTNHLHDFEPKRETIEGVPDAPINFVLDVPNDWEDGENPERGYDAMEATKFRSVIRPVPAGLSKTQKKAWRAKERLRWTALTGETKEKARSSPYPTPTQIRNAKAASTQVAALTDDSDILGIIDKLSTANIADPRDSMMKRINARLKTLQLMEEKLKEEKLELQRQVEEYLATIGKTDRELTIKIEPIDPRIASRNNNHDLNDFSALCCSTRINADPRIAAVPRNSHR
ncbi:uncharacterized protein [Venturia canescens]|nr:uncharacterized protein LOC122418158 isoform X2 [Venturia canescens]